jgi:hypothetical protein
VCSSDLLYKSSGKQDRFSDFKSSLSEELQWFDIIYLLIDKLNTTEDKVYEMNYLHCLNWLSYFKIKTETQQQ